VVKISRVTLIFVLYSDEYVYFYDLQLSRECPWCILRFVLCRGENLYVYEYQFLLTRSPYERIVGAQQGTWGAFRKVDGDYK
jgi:hypothetical protein